MSYKTTLLNEYKTIKEDLKKEILEIVNNNTILLNDKNITEFDLTAVKNNFAIIEQKENQIKYCNEQIQEVLKMENVA